MKIDWSRVIVGSLIGVILPDCSSTPVHESALAPAVNPADPTARSFRGSIVSLRPANSIMLVSKDEYHGRDQFPNIIQVKYNADTQFLIDQHPATLDQLQQYMTVSINGHMKDGQLIAETANFSAALPANVRPAPVPQSANADK